MGAKYAKLPLIKIMPPFNSSTAIVCLKVEVFQPISFRQRNMSSLQQITTIVMVNSGNPNLECQGAIIDAVGAAQYLKLPADQNEPLAQSLYVNVWVKAEEYHSIP
jgi:hypothetical protein